MINKRAERAPWNNFPPVIRNGDLKELEREPEYQAAKGGDQEAALAIAERLVKPETVEAIRAMVGNHHAKIVPVLANEQAGNNKIPLMTAEVLGDRLNLEVEYNIVQSEKVGRTNKGADHRLAINPTFDGKVEAGRPYVLVDDTLSMGGTLSSLRGYIENRGGLVLGAAVMTAHPGAVDMAVKSKMLADIERKHGQAMNEYWKEEFGYGIEQLTQGEAGHLRKAPSVDAIRDRITAARNAAGWSLGEKTTGKEETRESHGPSLSKGTYYDKAEAFKTLTTEEILQRYPDDKSMLDASIVQAAASKFSIENIYDPNARARFMEIVRDRITDNLENGRNNPVPDYIEKQSKSDNDLEH
ncbi:MAG: phosphoribosyltransferase [Alishewanella aestuarii]